MNNNGYMKMSPILFQLIYLNVNKIAPEDTQVTFEETIYLI